MGGSTFFSDSEVLSQCQLLVTVVLTVQKDFSPTMKDRTRSWVEMSIQGFFVGHHRKQRASMMKHSCYNSVSIPDNRPWIFGGTLSVTPINSTFICQTQKFNCQTHLAKKWFWWQRLHIFQQNLPKISKICLLHKEFRFPQLYELYCPNLDNDQSVYLSAVFTVFCRVV